MNFNISIEREQQRISPIEAKENKLKLLNIFLYSTEGFKTFKEIPYAMSDLQYTYDLSDTESLDITIVQDEVFDVTNTIR